VQGTVRQFDLETRCGDVLLDDGQVLAFGAQAFDASGLRLLRLGQRVRLRVGDDGVVQLVTVATFPDPAGS
jgi:2-phospho-L-lactate guanylyltransferase